MTADFARFTRPVESVVPRPIPSAPPMPELFDPHGDVADPAKVKIWQQSVSNNAPGEHEPLVDVVEHGLRAIDVYHQLGYPAGSARTFLRAGAIDRVLAAQRALPEGFGLVALDGWRSSQLQDYLFHEAYSDPDREPGFIAPPTDDASVPAPHHTGGTVDLTLTWNDQPLGLGTPFDELTPRAFARSFEGATDPDGIVVRDARRLLRQVMVEQGFIGLAREWWHFEFGTRLWAAITGRDARYRGVDEPPS